LGGIKNFLGASNGVISVFWFGVSGVEAAQEADDNDDKIDDEIGWRSLPSETKAFVCWDSWETLQFAHGLAGTGTNGE
jgi:hypothetical protein